MTFGGAASVYTPDPKITIAKTASAQSAVIPSTVDYKVVVANSSSAGPAYQAVLTDTLYDPDGKIMYSRAWNLDTVAAGDEITLTYSVDYGTSTKPGIYRNVARLTGKQNYSYNGVGMATEASNTIEFSSGGQVLGTTATISEPEVPNTGACAVFLTSYLARGLRNNSGDVSKLQSFLNQQLGANIPVTGTFGPLTQKQVKNYQSRTGIKPASGAVYALTQQSINTTMCGGAYVPPQPVVSKAVPTTKATTAKKPASKPVVKKPAAKPATAKTAPAKTETPVVVTKPVVTPTKPSVSSWLKKLIPIASGQTN
jgi:uncharacterized repeat protein (TIGR01451 family)